jgi:monodehydroascorbate reductase (NADH)
VGWGLKPVVAFPEDRILARILTPEAAAFYTKYYELKGTELRPGITVKSLETKDDDEDGTVSAAVLSDGTSLATSFIVVGVGARPCTELFEGEGNGKKISIVKGPPGGVEVDSRLRSVSSPNLWACGDAAAFPTKCLFGSKGSDGESQPTRQEHVQHARSSAAFVARDIAKSSVSSDASSDSPSYSYLPYYYSRIFDLGWVFYGSSPKGSEAVEFGDRDAEAAVAGTKQTFGFFHLEKDEKGRKIVGAFLEGGSPEQNAVVRKLVEAGAHVDEESALGMEWASAKAAKL